MSKARTSSCARFRSGRDGVLGLCWQSLRLGRSLRQRRPLSGARISKSDASDYPGLWGKKGQRQSAFSGAACAGQRVPGVGSAALWGACWRRRLELRPGMGRGSGVVLHLHWWGMPGSVVGWRKRLVPHRRLGGREDLCRARLGVGWACRLSGFACKKLMPQRRLSTGRKSLGNPIGTGIVFLNSWRTSYL